MIVRRARTDDLAAMAEFAAALQSRPEHHVCYLGFDASAIAAEMIEDVDDWTEAAVIAEIAADGPAGRAEAVGWLQGSIDLAIGRVWWFGPFVARDEPDEWRAVADALVHAARDLLPATVTGEEWAPDDRHLALVDWAADDGGTVDTGSAVLVLDGPLDPPSRHVRTLTEADGPAVAELHDRLFPGTHTTGAALVARGSDDDRRCLVIDDGAAGVGGYVVVERQPDGAGYVDFVGVAPAARRRGLGAELVRAGVTELGCDRVSLTVRVDNHAARALYARLGFVEERVIVPVRRGFSLG